MSDFSLNDLERIVTERALADPAKSYTAKLVQAGVPKIAKKLGEEAAEAVIASVVGTREELTAESADVIYHLLVLLHARGIGVVEVMAELERRTAQTGLQEKASRRP